jgi:hypothetical protein
MTNVMTIYKTLSLFAFPKNDIGKKSFQIHNTDEVLPMCYV